MTMALPSAIGCCRNLSRWRQVPKLEEANCQARGAVIDPATAGCQGSNLHTVEGHGESRCAGAQPGPSWPICSGPGQEGIRTRRPESSHYSTEGSGTRKTIRPSSQCGLIL